MRSLLYIVICTVGLACVTPALAKKGQSENAIALKLNESVVSGQSLTLDTSLSALSDFYKGTAQLQIMSQDGTPIGAPIKVFSGEGSSNFDALKQVQLPPLRPGRYKVQGIFSIFSHRLDMRPKITGSNLYLDVQPKQVLSSNISFAQIERLELKKQLEAQGVDVNMQALSKVSNVKLRQALQRANAVSTIKVDNSIKLVADKPRASAAARAERNAIKTVTLSTPQLEVADSRKQLNRKTSRLDRENAVLESAANEQEQ